LGKLNKKGVAIINTELSTGQSSDQELQGGKSRPIFIDQDVDRKPCKRIYTTAEMYR